MLTEHAVIILASIGIIALVCQAVAWWLKLPAILFLLLAGMLAGPITGWLDPAALFGDLLFPFITLSVAVILFEGSLTLKIDEIRGTESEGANPNNCRTNLCIPLCPKAKQRQLN